MNRFSSTSFARKMGALIFKEMEAKGLAFTPRPAIQFQRRGHPLALPVPDWNKRVMTSKDFAEVCEREKIIVLRMLLPSNVNGYHTVISGVPFICISSELSRGRERVCTEFHELGHYFLHELIPLCSSNKRHAYSLRRWYEVEANACSIVALAPTFEVDLFMRVVADKAHKLIIKRRRRKHV